jgi:hypothetical protein
MRGCRLLIGAPCSSGTVALASNHMPAKRHVPRLDPKLAGFNLVLRRSRIERLGVFA